MIKKVKINDCALVTDYVANGSFASLKENVKYQNVPDYAVLVRLKDFTNSWKGNFVYVSKDSYNFLSKSSLVPGDLVVSNVGDTGKCFIVPDLGQPMTLGPNSILVRPDKNILLTKFLFYYISSPEGQRVIDKISSATAQKKFNKTDFRQLIMTLPTLTEQKRIATILDKANALRQKNKQLLAAYEELLQSTFLDMFGDPVTNPKGWKFDSLSNYGSFKNGLNYSKDDSGHNILCLGVGDFKNLTKLYDINSLQTVAVSSIPHKDYYLRNDDLVFVRSNGNRALVGRCLVVYPNDERVVFSGFCIRYRMRNDKLNSIYLSELFRNDTFKSVMLSKGRGANIQNINQKLLSSLLVPVPPITIQKIFAKIVENIEAQKTTLKQSIQESEDLFNGLVQKAFKGELNEQ